MANPVDSQAQVILQNYNRFIKYEPVGPEVFPLEEEGNCLFTLGSTPQLPKTNENILECGELELHYFGEEAVLQRVVPRGDGRQPVNDSNKFPNQIHAKIRMVFENKDQKELYGGSGSMIGPHHLLTCGHNVYDSQMGWAKDICIYPARDGQYAPLGQARAARVYIFDKWKSTQDKAYDIALLVLDSPIGLATGWGGMVSVSGQNSLFNEKFSITGYPKDKSGYQMWTMTHEIETIEPEIFRYAHDTNKGQSGSAIWNQKGNRVQIIGVHTSGPEKGTMDQNSGSRITKEKIQKLLVEMIRATYKLLPSDQETLVVKKEEAQIAGGYMPEKESIALGKKALSLSITNIERLRARPFIGLEKAEQYSQASESLTVIGHFGSSLLKLDRDPHCMSQFNNPVAKEVLNRATRGVKVDVCIVAPHTIKDKNGYTFQNNFGSHLESVQYAQTLFNEAKKLGGQKNISIIVLKTYPPFTGDFIDLSNREKAKLTMHPVGYHHHFDNSIHFMMDVTSPYVAEEKQGNSIEYIQSVEENIKEMKEDGYTITSANIGEYIEKVQDLGANRPTFKKGFKSLLVHEEKRKALDVLGRKLKIAEEVNDKSRMMEALGSIGSIFVDLGEKEKALDVLGRKLKIAEEVNDKSRIEEAVRMIKYLGL